MKGWRDDNHLTHTHDSSSLIQANYVISTMRWIESQLDWRAAALGWSPFFNDNS